MYWYITRVVHEFNRPKGRLYRASSKWTGVLRVAFAFSTTVTVDREGASYRHPSRGHRGPVSEVD